MKYNVICPSIDGDCGVRKGVAGSVGNGFDSQFVAEGLGVTFDTCG
jgi:hypothetical protein